MKIAIVGAGLIGLKRAESLPKEMELEIVCDLDPLKGEQFAEKFNCQYEPNWKKVVLDKSIYAIFICTPHNLLSEIAVRAIKNCKDVLIEKPAGRNLEELKKVLKAQEKNPVVVTIGYNHRFHPAIVKAKRIVESGEFGEILFLRGRYGHGGRIGYEKEWRFNKGISGGGELMDQAPHLIDLANLFCGQMDEVNGKTARLFWKSEVEDSVFFQMTNDRNQLAHFSATWLERNNIFCFEIMLEKGKLQIDGLGRSYGREKLTIFKTPPQLGAPQIKEIIFPEADTSWKDENDEFLKKIKKRDCSSSAISDAIFVLKTIKKIYSQNL